MPYRYLGNKTRISDWIVEVVSRYAPPNGVVADLMCGTASVSRAFADHGYQVIASDQLHFPVLHAKARLLFDHELGFDKIGHTYESALAYLNSLNGATELFYCEYGAAGNPRNGRAPRRYFTAENAALIDAMRRQIREWRLSGLEDQACDLLLHDLILASNRVANIAGTYGYFRATWNPDSLLRLELTPSRQQPAGCHRVVEGPASDVVGRVSADVIYLDPPYTKRQYAGNYHIPETLAKEDAPDPAGDGGLRDWASQSSDFCFRRRARAAFERIMANTRSPIVVWSYSGDGQLSPNELLKTLSQFGQVECHTKRLRRYRSNGRVEPGEVKEFLYVVVK